MFGYAGARHATQALLKEPLDLLIVLGATLNVRDSMHWTGAALQPKLGVMSVNVSPFTSAATSSTKAFIGGHAGAFVRWLAGAPRTIAKPLERWHCGAPQWLQGGSARCRAITTS